MIPLSGHSMASSTKGCPDADIDNKTNVVPKGIQRKADGSFLTERQIWRILVFV